MTTIPLRGAGGSNKSAGGSAVLLGRILLGLVMALVPVRGAHAQATPGYDEYRVKAVFLYRFAGYIEWPLSTPEDTHWTFTIGVIGKDRFGDAFTDIEGKTVGGRPVVIKRFRSVEELEAVDILYVGDSENKRLQEVLEALGGHPTLTVGDDSAFLPSGGIIRFVVGDNVQFQVNRCAADLVGLHISAQLLKVATQVTDRCGGASP